MALDISNGQAYPVRCPRKPWPRCSYGSPGEDFAGTIICDGWTAYPALSERLQRCWAHILQEAEDAAEQQEEGEPIYHALTQLYIVLQTRLESDLTLRERAELQRIARRELEALIERSVPDGPVATLLGKIEGGLDHRLTFIGDPAVSPINDAAENALREPVVLRKIIKTLRNDRGIFVHETLLTLLATWSQQGRNPCEELKRVVQDNKMISRTRAVPAVESAR